MDASSSKRGFALAGAVFAMVIIATLVTGAFFVAMQQSSVGRSSATYQRAFEAAEAGLGNTVAAWSTTTLNALAVGDSSAVSGSLGAGGSYAGYVRRLSQEMFLIRVVGSDPTNTASRTLAGLTRLQMIAMNFSAGLTTRSSLKVGGSSYINGANTAPSGWGCATPTDTLAGVLTSDSTLIETSGCGGYSCIQGTPKIQQDTTISDSTFFTYGDLEWSDLVAMATKIYPTGAVGPLNSLAAVGTASTCTTTVLNNWGEPNRPGAAAGCYGYFPIIYVNGNLNLTGGYGQGILLVEGDLMVQGGFEFYGPVIVRGHFETQGTGGHFNGGVMAANVDLELSSVLGNAVITYSSCAITRALQASASGRLLGQRSWAEIVQ